MQSIVSNITRRLLGIKLKCE